MANTGTPSLFCFLLVVVGVSVQQVDGVWPLPQQLDQSWDRYSLSPQLFSFTYGQDSAAQTGCSVLDAAFKRYFSIIFPDFTKGTENVLQSMWSEPQPFVVSVTVKTRGCDGYPNEDSDESYNLSVSEGQALLRSVSVWGALRGLESFSQLVYQNDYGAYFINKTEIVDFPRFAFRGLLLDTSRHYLPLHDILKTLSDVMRVIEHARMRGIRVVPEFDSPGHTQSWGKGQPGLLTPCYKGSVPSGSFGPVDPTVDTTYKFMESLLKEVNIMNMTAALNKTSIVWQDVFDYHERPRSKYVVEVWKQGCYLCEMRRVTKAGLKVILAAPFYLDLPIPTHSWPRYYNCFLLSQIPQDTVLEIWKGKNYKTELSRMTSAGHRVLLSAPWYINHISTGQDWRDSYAVQPQNFSGTDEQKKLVIGGEVAMWGEYVDATNLTPRLWPRACAAAERLWSNEEKTMNADVAFPRLTEFRCELLRRGIQAEPLFVGHCKHEYDGL
ncbi:Beta-hexosaminidase subunit alpha [Labeo rohita]|uniref:Beta-hexosaminidase n=1 Tax=Labeo rohita TaxID=84645 RepID=A0ABQ8LEX2_LABRO|nr:Beta-hexosaminidase subunit alpha [Labeo rohita]